MIYFDVQNQNKMPVKFKPEDEIDLLEKEKKENHLVLYNDEVNTFDWVIESLIKICKHDFVQAEQCSMIVHHNGKCSVKDGGFDDLKPMKEALIERGLSATIE